MSAQHQARLLLDKAWEDFVLLQEVVNNRRITDAQFGFHAQQSVEKALKAWIWALGTRPDRTHDLESLSSALCEILQIELPELGVLHHLGVFAVIYRYDVFDWDEPIDRGKIIQDVNALLDRVETEIKKQNKSESI